MTVNRGCLGYACSNVEQQGIPTGDASDCASLPMGPTIRKAYYLPNSQHEETTESFPCKTLTKQRRQCLAHSANGKCITCARGAATDRLDL